MDANELKTYSEIAKNVAASLALLGGAWAVFVWIFQRRDRAADVLLMLETRFAETKVVAGRGEVEDQAMYDQIKPALAAANAYRNGGPALTVPLATQLENLDAMLRFYVVLLGIRRARQVPEVSLRTCYRYWLGQYYSAKRPEFREYVDNYFRTLSSWLKDDTRRGARRRFFDPQPER